MRQIWDFHGGIHPPENKHQSTQQDIRPSSIPARLILPLSQHIGQPADPIVIPGQTVKKGEMIAEAVGPVSVSIHAPTSGTIIEIGDFQVPHPSGLTDKCILLEPDHLDEWAPLTPCSNYRELDPKDILERVRHAGIAGLGGAGFPTAIKLHPPRNDKVNALILNAAECEPYITADDRLMRERAAEIIGGLEIMAYILEPEECLIGIEDNKPEAIAALRKAAVDTRVEIVVIPTKYPSGGEKQLVKILTGLEVPHRKIPADIGVMCQNVGTAAAVFRAIRYGEPLISRVTTVTGAAVTQPGNFEVLIGTPMRHLLEQAGFESGRASRVLMGGPMMGFALPNIDLPLVKTTNCILAATEQEFPTPAPEQACIRCGMCAEACPAELLPQQLFWFSKAQEFEKAEMYNLFDCIECGACSYVCPSSIPLVQYYRFAKSEVRNAHQEQLKSDKARERFEFRQTRLQREQEEKEAKRKARAEAAAAAQAARASAVTAPVDPKKAAVEAAVQRAQAKRQLAESGSSSASSGTTSTAATGNQPALPDIKTLEQNVEKAEEKLAKVRESLQDAENQQSNMTEKLRNAVAKNQVRLDAAITALEEASKTVAATPGSDAKPTGSQDQSQEQLERALKRQEEKVATLTKAISDCEIRDPERALQLQPSLTKALEKLADLKTSLGTTDSPQPNQTPELPDLDTLQGQIGKAQDKLALMQGMLDEAKAEAEPDQAKIDKLTRAVEKNQERLAAAEQAYRDAEALVKKQVAESPAQAEPDTDLDTLKANIDKAQDKLAMMQGMLEEAQAESPVDDNKVAKLTRAVEKNRERVTAAEKAFTAAGGNL